MSSTKALARFAITRERFARLNNIKIHADGGWFARIPGFKYDDFNRAGLLTITKIDRIAQTFAVMANVDQRISEMMWFAVGRSWTFSPRLYQQAAVNFPMNIRLNWNGIGKSSLDLSQIYYAGDQSTAMTETATDGAARSVDCEPLAALIFRLVNVDPITRKPASLPDFFTSIADKVVNPTSQRFPSIRPPTSIPDRSYRCRVRVRYDDMDWYFHTNVSSYLGFALECATKAANAGFYSAINEDIAFYRVKKATSIYVSESGAGDELEVSTWEDVNQPMLLNFTVSKDGKLIYFAHIEFYDRSIGS